MSTADCIADLEAERDDALAALSVVTRVFAIGSDAPTLNACAQAIVEAVRGELAAEECALCLRGASGALLMIGFSAQADRLGGPRDGSSTAGLVALGQLQGEGNEPRCFAVAPEGGFTTISFDALQGAGAVAVPFACGDGPGGVLLARWLVAPPMRFGRAAKLRLIGSGVGQAIGLARDREGHARVATALEAELVTVRGSVVEHEQDLRSSTERIESLAAELVRANRVKHEFLATMSHELRTPLAAILGFGGLLRDGTAGELQREQSQMLDRVLSSARHLHVMIDDVLFFVECECDRVRVEQEELATADVVADVLTAFPVLPRADRVAFDVEIAPGAGRLLIDRRLGRRLLFHLLSNAFKFTSSGSIHLAIAPDPSGGVCIRLQDTGVGIPAPRLDAIFDAFTQGDSSTTRRYDGMGLGLTLVQRCVRLMGGTVHVDSTLDHGTVVTVTLPGALDAPVVAPRRSGPAAFASTAALD